MQDLARHTTDSRLKTRRNRTRTRNRTGIKKMILLLAITVLACTPTFSQEKSEIMNQDPTGLEITLDDYHWKNRVIVLFASSSENERYKTQWDEFAADEEGLSERDIVLISIFDQGKSRINGQEITAVSTETIKQRLGESGSRFTVILIGKDGTTKLRKHEILSVVELYRTIDSMPMRQWEMRDRTSGSEDGGS